MMSHVLTVCRLAQSALFGARNYGGVGRSRSSVGTGEVILYLMIAGAAIAVVCSSIYLGSRLVHRRRHHSHGGLFAGLCRTHGLDRSTRGLLKQVARFHKLQQPARVFVDPKWLDPSSLQGPLRRQALRVAALRNRLFREDAT